ncbi:MAG: PHP domain-containing protein, partial [Ktedonobacterales bacterium]
VRTLDDLVELCGAAGYGETLGKMITTAGYDWMYADAAVIVEAAHASGAVCLIAHPGRGDGFCSFDAPELDLFRTVAPVDGIEVLYPLHSIAQVELYREYVVERHLLASAGSDCHGKLDKQAPIKYPAQTCRALLERLGVRMD